MECYAGSEVPECADRSNNHHRIPAPVKVFEGIKSYGQGFNYYDSYTGKTYWFDTIAFCSSWRYASHEVGVRLLDEARERDLEEASHKPYHSAYRRQGRKWELALREWSVETVPLGKLQERVSKLENVSYHLE